MTSENVIAMAALFDCASDESTQVHSSEKEWTVMYCAVVECCINKADGFMIFTDFFTEMGLCTSHAHLFKLSTH